MRENFISSEMKKIMNMTDKERLMLCDLGYYNDVIRGYMIMAMEDSGFSKEEINRGLAGLNGVFDLCNAEDARDVWKYSDY